MNISRRSIMAGLTLLIMGSMTLGADIPYPTEPGGADSAANPKLRGGAVRITDEKADGPLHKSVRTYAQWFAYRIAQPPFNGEPEPKKANFSFVNDINKLIKEAEDYCTLTVTPPATSLTVAQLEFADLFTAEIATATKFVLDNSTRPIERLNTVRLMAACSKMPGTKLIDPLLAIINNPNESDALRLYAFQGIRNFLDHGHPEDATRHLNYKDVAKLGQISESLSKYILQKRTVRDDKEKAVIEYVRKEAVSALSHFRLSVIRETTRKAVSRPGYTLMRVLWDPEIVPPVTLSERVDAICGFCQMKIDDDLNIDVAAPFLQPSLVEFIRQANNDAVRMKKENTLAVLPWKISAARLSYSFAVWREAAKPIAKNRNPDYITTLAAEVIPTLAPIEKEGPSALIQSDGMVNWINKNLPKAWESGDRSPLPLFKDDPSTLLPIVPKNPVMKTPDPKNPKGPLPKGDPKVDPKVDPKGPPPKKGPPTKN